METDTPTSADWLKPGAILGDYTIVEDLKSVTFGHNPRVRDECGAEYHAAEIMTGSRPVILVYPTEDSTLAWTPELLRLPQPLRQLIRQSTDVAPEKRPSDADAMQQLFAGAIADLG